MMASVAASVGLEQSVAAAGLVQMAGERHELRRSLNWHVIPNPVICELRVSHRRHPCGTVTPPQQPRLGTPPHAFNVFLSYTPLQWVVFCSRYGLVFLGIDGALTSLATQVIILGDSGYGLRWSALCEGKTNYICSECPLQCRKDFAHEPVCQQAVQQPVQGDHWCRLVSRAFIHLRSGSLTYDLHSLTKEVMVDDRLVTMQVCLFLPCLGSANPEAVVGYCGSGAFPVARCRLLPRSRLLCTRIRCQQLEIL